MSAERALWSLLAALLLVNAPAFVCMGLDPDALQWDLDTRAVLDGGVLYRDSAENNLPGMFVPLAVLHTLFGWRSEVLRAADLLIVLVIAWQLTHLLPGATRGQRLGLVVALLVFYLSTSEWCHCQRDTWMMVPALAALSLRVRQAERLTRPSSSRAILGAAFVEGLLWAAAFWVKPFVAVPALACWLLTARFASRRLNLLLDGSAMLAGGLVAGAVGIAWLVASGAWPWFVEAVFVWNREYIANDPSEGHYWLSIAGLVYRFFPWIGVHLLAVPVALGKIRRGTAAETLLAGFYLGWLLQCVLLQHKFDYVHVPPVLLGLTVVASWYVGQPAYRRIVFAGLLISVVLRFPSLCRDRLAVWGDCLEQGSTPAMRDRLTLLPKTNWADLERVKDYLREQDIGDGELSCMHMPTISLYRDLGVRPATRFNFVRNFVVSLPRQRAVILGELEQSRQRFMVCDTEATPAGSGRVVFQSGRYVVLRLAGAETPAWIDEVVPP